MTNEKVNKAKAKTTSIANQKLKPAGKNDANKAGVSNPPDTQSPSNKDSGPSGENL